MTDRPPLLPTYSEYKPSGIPWLGDIPAHWETRRLKYVARIIGGATPSSIVPEYWDGDITWITPQDLGKLTSPYIHEGERRITRKGYESCGTTTAPAGSIVLSTRAPIGHVAILKNPACVNQGCRLLIPNSTIHSEYLYYTLKSVRANHELKSLGQGSTFMELSRMKLASLKVPLPPPEEQAAIARYLTHKDALIQRFLQGKQRMLDLLKQLRKSTIHYTVTRGLDPDNTPMKPSGLPWLEEIPAHWEVAAVKWNYAIQLGKMLQNEPKSPTDVETPYLKAQHVHWFSVRTTDVPTMWASPRDIEHFGIRKGDLLVCEGGEGGRSAIVGDVPPGCIIQNALHRVRPRGNCRNDYLLYVMSEIGRAGWFDAINNRVTIAHFTVQKFRSLKVPIPPIEEQAAIAKYLDDKVAKIDAAIAVTIRIIDQMRQYRKSLIHEVVTGVRDVRKAAAAIPDDPDDSDA